MSASNISAAESCVTISAAGAARIRAMLAKRDDATMVRLDVIGGGCSGFQYEFSFDTTQREDDLMLERDGAIIVIDAASLDFLGGAEIDYSDDLIGAAFRIHNPNVTASCGCGTSFSL